jgi:hypothetical protein
MSPEERRLLSDLFDRVRNAATTTRDRDAEDLIAQKLREQPYATYYLAQAVIIQDQALQGMTQRLQELEDEVQRLEAEAGSARNQSGGFLGSLGSIFGGGQPSPRLPARDTYSQREGRLYDDYASTNRYRDPDPQPAPSPWGRDGATGPWAQPTSMSSSGGFLRGALTTAAGVAGGVLVADAVRDMFSSNMGGTNNNFTNGLFGENRPSETVVNNFFDNDKDDNKDDKADARSGGDSDSGGGSGWAGNDRDDDDGYDTADDSDFGDDGGGDDSSFA